MGDKYDEMTGIELRDLLGERELPLTGRVEELRDRLREDDKRRAQAPEDDPQEDSEGEETSEGQEDVPEPRKPVDYSPMALVLSEAQARVLQRGEASLKRHFRYVTDMADRKFCEGDRVFGVADWANRVCRVLPFGVEVPLEDEDEHADGLEQLRAAGNED